MLFVLILILKLTTLDISSKFHSLIKVLNSISSYFENTESPIICYKYNKKGKRKPIRNTILTFYKLVSDLDIETSVPDFLDCKDPKFCYQPAGHIVTGNLFLVTATIKSSIWTQGEVS